MKVLRPLFLLLSLSYAGAWFTPSVVANDLTQVQQQIKQQQAKVAQQRKQRNTLQTTLKAQEVEMNRVINKLKQTEMSLAEIRDTIKKTEQQIKRLEQQEKEQKEKLKQQLDSAYRSGIHPGILEKLLSTDAKDAERMTAYYEHINNVRIELIQDLRRTQQELKDQRDAVSGQQKDQQKQLAEQKKQEKDLQKVKNERESTLKSLDKTLARDESRLEELKNNEAALRKQIERAAQAAAAQEKQERAQYEQKKATEEKRTNKPYQPTEQEQQIVRAGQGLGAANKQYRMPVTGKILNSFGSTQAGELKWKGMVIQASAGTAVRAIADGRVILADWLQGYGQVVVIDHGKGDMSLYGYNQSISVRNGTRVKTGQVIAGVGSSGGQSRAALYFEIRRQGVPVNPARWVK